MKQDIQVKLLEILNKLNGYFLYIKMGGSRSLPFIKNPSDYDIIVICKDATDRDICMRLYRENFNLKELRLEYKLDLHFITLEYETNFLVNSIYPYFVLKTDLMYSTIKNYLPDRPLEYILSQKQSIIANYKDKLFNKLLKDESTLYKHKF